MNELPASEDPPGHDPRPRRDERLAADAGHHTRLEAALLETQARLEAELADSRLLQSISAELITQDNIDALYRKIIDAAVRIMRSDFASMQMLRPGSDGGVELKLLGFVGFVPRAAEFWETVRVESRSTCGEALRTGRRVVVPDVDECPFMADSEDLAMYHETGIRAVQTTPLVSRSGAVVGMISTHWRRPYRPSERDLRLLDILARQACEVVERKQAEEALREADRRKDEFLAMLGHELRNPLGVITNALVVLDRAGPDGQDADRMLTLIRRQTAHLTRLLDDLLDVVRITSGRIELRWQPVDLREAVRLAYQSERARFEAKAHAMTLSLPDAPVLVTGDPVRLQQIVGNVVNNACKYTPAYGDVAVRLDVEAAEAVVRVEDGGPGISLDEVASIFELFTRGRNDITEPGLGVGLALVRRLVELHGGSVEAQGAGSRRGALFVVRLPLAREPLSQTAPEQRPAAPAPARRILVIEDNVDTRETLVMLLGLHGHLVEQASTGSEAIQIASRWRPDVVLLDIGLPDTDGYTVGRVIREKLGAGIRIVALTGYGQRTDRSRSAEAGFDVHLVKPVNPDELSRVLAGPMG